MSRYRLKHKQTLRGPIDAQRSNCYNGRKNEVIRKGCPRVLRLLLFTFASNPSISMEERKMSKKPIMTMVKSRKFQVFLINYTSKKKKLHGLYILISYSLILLLVRPLKKKKIGYSLSLSLKK